METWKVGAIAALLIGLFGFGFYEQQHAGELPPPVVLPGTPRPTPMPVLDLNGKILMPWNLTDASQWANTPKPIKTADLRGHYALVEIFRTGCSHCQEAAPLLEGIYQRYVPRGLKMVAIESPVSEDEADWEKVKSWLVERDVRYPVAFDKGSTYFQKTLKGQTFPTLMVLDKAGKVIHFHTGFSYESPDNPDNPNIQRIIGFAALFEKLFPGPGTPAQRAKDLAQWLWGHGNGFRLNLSDQAELERRVLAEMKAPIR